MDHLYGISLIKNQNIDSEFIKECKLYNSELIQCMIKDYELNKDIIIKNNLKVIIHCSYDFNICNPYYKESYNFIKFFNEMKFAYENPNIIGYVLHFGFIPKNKDNTKDPITKEKSTDNFIINIIRCLKDIKKEIENNTINKKQYFSLLLEPLVGNQNEIVQNLDDLKYFMERINNDIKKHVQGIKICLDTAHLFAMGYNIKDDLLNVFKEIADKVGLHNIGLIHLNDQEYNMNEHKDKHMMLGKGTIGLKNIYNIYCICKSFNISFICETDGSVKNNIGLLKDIDKK